MDGWLIARLTDVSFSSPLSYLWLYRGIWSALIQNDLCVVDENLAYRKTGVA